MKLVVNGHALYAYTGGVEFDPALPCVVFVHGALNDHSVWTLLARWFAHHGRTVLAVDLPGHGRSGGPPPASVEAAADGVQALLDAAGVERAALVGHSLGSLIALEAAARAPDRVTHLGLVGTAFPMKVSPALLATARETPQAAIDLVNAFSLSTIAAKPSYPAPGTWLHGAQRALMRRLQGQAEAQGLNLFAHDFAICDAYGRGQPSPPALSRAAGEGATSALRCPVAVVVGAKDTMTPPKAARELAAALNACVTTLPAGHSLMAEAPDGVLAALRALLD
ncbi:alpha/beta fold hydrolase [Rubrivivax gelatinosus]|uniref:Pimeloyl-ACP methyl ester carboxylesterase n=1 Tax=Rubrivivax gelatinosus TaxID=28068 RepID=A0A4R2M5V6_RUBGE|nr:alpha/beta hydrolase [Rubrivivax gelatinosus]MBK1686857.1 alpha/beta hydrolase [Rubrivivax gelatinosus]TCP01441.1 pimeloyl-ACP methyl ester carboxylesterase [Rubrivivax gelatinosus]